MAASDNANIMFSGHQWFFCFCCLVKLNLSGYHLPSIVIYYRKRSSATRRDWRTLQGQLFRHSAAVGVVIVRSFSRNNIVRVVIVRCCLTKGRSPVKGRQLATIVFRFLRCSKRQDVWHLGLSMRNIAVSI